MSCTHKRLGLIAALLFALAPSTQRKQVPFAETLACASCSQSSAPLAASNAGKKSADKNQYFTGKVVRLATLLAEDKIQVDADIAPYVLVFHAEDGKIYPLIKDDGSRMFFKDARLLQRPMRLYARIVPNSSFLQVINVHSILKGKLHDVYYWCDVCTIKRFEAGICDCCGDPMVLREEPAKGD